MCGVTRERLDVDGDVPGGLHLDVRTGRAGAGTCSLVALAQWRVWLDGLLAEVDRQPRAVDLGLAAGVVMDLEDHVGAGRHGTADPVGQVVRDVAGRPAAEVALDLDARARIGRIARPRVERRRAARPAPLVSRNAMMWWTTRRFPGWILDRRDERVAPAGSWGSRSSDRGPGPVAGTCEVLAHLEDEVGRAQGPAVRELRGGRELSFSSPSGRLPRPRRRARRPRPRSATGSCLSFGPDPRHGLPRRHRPVPGHRGDVDRPLSGLLVGLQRERARPGRGDGSSGSSAGGSAGHPWCRSGGTRLPRAGSLAARAGTATLATSTASAKPPADRVGPGRTVRISSGMRSQEVGAVRGFPADAGSPGDTTKNPPSSGREPRLQDLISSCEIRMSR